MATIPKKTSLKTKKAKLDIVPEETFTEAKAPTVEIEDKIEMVDNVEVKVEPEVQAKKPDNFEKLIAELREKVVNGTITDGESVELGRLLSSQK